MGGCPTIPSTSFRHQGVFWGLFFFLLLLLFLFSFSPPRYHIWKGCHWGERFCNWYHIIKTLPLEPEDKYTHTHTYEFKRGFAMPIIFIFNLRRNVPYFYKQPCCRPMHHGGQRLWPIPSPGACQCTNRACGCHPHTMGDATYGMVQAWVAKNLLNIKF